MKISISHLLLISLIPLLFFIIDGYFQNNVKRGFIQVLAFVISAVLVVILIRALGIIFVLTVPFLILTLVLAKRM